MTYLSPTPRLYDWAISEASGIVGIAKHRMGKFATPALNFHVRDKESSHSVMLDRRCDLIVSRRTFASTAWFAVCAHSDSSNGTIYETASSLGDKRRSDRQRSGEGQQ